MSKTSENTRTIDGIEYNIVENVQELPGDLRTIVERMAKATESAESADTARAHLVGEYLALTRKHRVRLTQTKLAEVTGVKQPYVAQISGALKLCAEKAHGGDFGKAVAELKNAKSVNKFKATYKKPAAPRPQTKDTEKGLSLEGFDAIRTAIVMIRSQVRQQMTGWTKEQRSQVADAVLEIYDDLEEGQKMGEQKANAGNGKAKHAHQPGQAA